MKVTTHILSLATAAGMVLGMIGSSGAVASADTHYGADSTCGAPQRTNADVMVDGIPTIQRQSDDTFDGGAMIGRSNAESFDGVATTARVSEEATDGVVSFSHNGVDAFAGSALTLQAHDGSDCFPVSPGRAPEQ